MDDIGQGDAFTTPRPCEDCGALSPAGEHYDVAVHDCKTDEWQLITITPKGWDEVDKFRAEQGLS